MDRTQSLLQIQSHPGSFDIVIIGGGATGLGAAVDAAARGHTVALIEQSDFAKGTSSRSTKLVHGGVRYLRQGNIPLVLDALRERGLLYQNAPHLVRNLSFIIPTYHWHETLFYGAGLKVYDRLAGSLGFGASQFLSKSETMQRLPTLDASNLMGGVMYQDGQFDDARLAINLAQTATTLGGAIVNYVCCTGLLRQNGRVIGVQAKDVETDEVFDILGKTVINATGVFVDHIRQMDEPDESTIIMPSQGVHLVIPPQFLPGAEAVLIPKTEDGRVLFAVPWHGRVILGTTDTPLSDITLEPRALPEEIEFILKHAAQYLSKAPTHRDVLSVYAGLRPLIRANVQQKTAALSRDHQILVSSTGLITIAGGKWTTYRKMAEDVINQAEQLGGLTHRCCHTQTLQIHGWTHEPIVERNLCSYGSDASKIRILCQQQSDLSEPLHPQLEFQKAEVIWQTQHEMARQVEDVLARRTRALFLCAKTSIECAPVVAQLMAQELGYGQPWIDHQVTAYRSLAEGYLL
jgi:glycerol-3-phosphate dehydrogenase